MFERQAPVRLRENANDLLTIPPLSVPTMLRNQVANVFRIKKNRMEIIRNQGDHGDDQVDQLPGGHALQKRGKFGEELIWTWSEYHTQVSTLLVSCIFTQPKGVSLT